MAHPDPVTSSQSVPLTPPSVYPEPIPYDALSQFGVEYHSTMSQINRSGQAAQRARALDPQRRRAWQLLRNTEERLKLDLFCLQTNPAVFDPDANSDETTELKAPELQFPDLEPPTLQMLLEALGPLPDPEIEDAGEPPPIEPDLIALLAECWPMDSADLPELPPPTSFLDCTS